MFGNLSGPTLLVILFIVLLLFGAPKLPALARSLGQSMKILRKEVRGDENDEPATGSGSSEHQVAPTEIAQSQAETPASPAPASPDGESKNSSS